jgi:hypothetical protein
MKYVPPSLPHERVPDTVAIEVTDRGEGVVLDVGQVGRRGS